MKKTRNKPFVIKASGRSEPFSKFKLARSLKRAGAGPKTAERIVVQVAGNLQGGEKTRDIHRLALGLLEKQGDPVAARYNLKEALAELGPTGYPFETFLAHMFKSLGYSAQTRQVLAGRCVTHEVDVVGRRGNDHIIVEAKFHNSAGFKTDVKVALYVKARFDDILAGPARKPHLHKAWLVTNTKFTTQAIKYAECAGLKLLGWNYPINNSLQKIVESAGLVPLTALTGLSHSQKRQLLADNIVLCRDLVRKPRLLAKLRLNPQEKAFVEKELQQVWQKK